MPDYKLAAKRAARRHGINPTVFLAMIRQESGFNPSAKSPAGAQGIAQFMPATAKSYGVKLGDGRAADDLDGAARYLKDALKRTDGDYRQALSIYNSGRPDGYLKFGETKNYVRTILGDKTPSAKQAPARARTTTRTIPGVDRSADRQQVVWSYLQQPRYQPADLTTLVEGLKATQSTPARTVKTTAPPTPPKDASPASGGDAGSASFDGKPVAAWIKPLLEYARERGWKGTVTSGVRTDAEQKRIYDSGVRPAAKPRAYGGAGSKHEQTGFLKGAVDVTDARTLDRILKAKHSRLKFAGAKDPVHFSVPNPDGSY